MYTIERLEPVLSDEVACDVNAFENGLAAELDPGQPPLPVALTKAYAKHWDPTEVDDAYVARAEDGTVVGTAWMSAPIHDNPHLTFTRLGVAADHRCKGVATQLFARFVAFAAANDRTSLTLGADLYHPAADHFAAALGAPVAMRAHVNQLLLSDLPDGLIDEWIGGASPDYELCWVPDNDYPEEWIADLCIVTDVLMNDAPMDDVPVGERRTRPDQVRAIAKRTRAFGRDWWTLIARHKATGEAVGYTQMFYPHENPVMASQGATAVGGAHRGHALGRWLKAAMLERMMRERPDVTYVRTFNADSNDPMLAINFAMGFKNLLEARRWVIDLADAEKWLETRT